MSGCTGVLMCFFIVFALLSEALNGCRGDDGPNHLECGFGGGAGGGCHPQIRETAFPHWLAGLDKLYTDEPLGHHIFLGSTTSHLHSGAGPK